MRSSPHYSFRWSRARHRKARASRSPAERWLPSSSERRLLRKWRRRRNKPRPFQTSRALHRSYIMRRSFSPRPNRNRRSATNFHNSSRRRRPIRRRRRKHPRSPTRNRQRRSTNQSRKMSCRLCRRRCRRLQSNRSRSESRQPLHPVPFRRLRQLRNRHRVRLRRLLRRRPNPRHQHQPPRRPRHPRLRPSLHRDPASLRVHLHNLPISRAKRRLRIRAFQARAQRKAPRRWRRRPERSPRPVQRRKVRRDPSLETPGPRAGRSVRSPFLRRRNHKLRAVRDRVDRAEREFTTTSTICSAR